MTNFTAGEATAYWPTADTILTPLAPEEGCSFELIVSLDASLVRTETGIEGGMRYPLSATVDGVPTAVLDKFPHLAGLTALTLPPDALERVPELLCAQVVLTATDAEGELLTATGLQIPGVLDELYTYDGPLGLAYDQDGQDGVPTLRLWAPTAQKVRLFIYADAATAPDQPDHTFDLARDEDTAVWSITGDPAWTGQYYLYEVTVYVPSVGDIVPNLVTDPYALDLSMNSKKTRFVNLDDPATMPAGWLDLAKPPLNRPEDIVLYELHIRDFSAYDESVPVDLRGKYLAFTCPSASGRQHLRALAEAGLTHIHLLPAFDIASIDEDPAARREPEWDTLQQGGPAATTQQEAVEAVRHQDAFNWGYDPYHYAAPEGSYATNPDDGSRVIEFRQMVQALNETDLRVVMDVVYNHTNASGQNDTSVLDRIVPGYYHRLDDHGRVEQSTCCQNTATEHNMMRKLMVDTLVLWVKQYKVDGFRFDLMGHHMRADMTAVREALDSLTVEKDGVDGRAIYVYGEGWDFGEVADNARGINASQENMGGTGIGVFNDRLRDAVRGGTPFAAMQEQGLATGLYVDPNEAETRPPEEQKAQALLYADWIRTSLAGALADYEFENAAGEVVPAHEILYANADGPAGYTAVPRENVNYVSAHDNETLFDDLQYKLPVETSLDDRVRVQTMAHSLVMLAQGIPFFHAGSDLLRSKSLDRNSYDSGDWFNRLDFTYQTNNWGVGLPPASDNEAQWPLMRPLLENPALKPAPEQIERTTQLFQELLRIRRSSLLLRLDTAEAVQAKLRFHNTGPEQIPGLIAMSLDDTQGTAVDETFSHLVVIFNATLEEQVVELSLADFDLHPVQQASVDDVVRTASYAEGTFTVPARTTAVFVAYKAEEEAEEAEREEETVGLAEEAVGAATTALTMASEPSIVAQPLPEEADHDQSLLMALALLTLGVMVFIIGFLRRNPSEEIR